MAAASARALPTVVAQPAGLVPDDDGQPADLGIGGHGHVQQLGLVGGGESREEVVRDAPRTSLTAWRTASATRLWPVSLASRARSSALVRKPHSVMKANGVPASAA